MTSAAGRRTAAALAVCAAAAVGCAATVQGTARPSSDPPSALPSTSAAAPPSEPMVAAKDVKGLLLGVGELEQIAGDTTMTNVGVTTEANRRLGVRVQPTECRYPGNSGSSSGYGGPSNVAFAGDAYQGANRVYVEQNVAGFDSRDSPVVSAFNGVTYGWELCPENEPYTIFTDSTFVHYVRGPVDAAPRRVAVTVTKQEPPRRACRHVAAAKANVIAEAVVCGDGDVTHPADEIVDRILAKVPD